MSDDYAKEGKRVKSVIERRQAAMREAMGEEENQTWRKAWCKFRWSVFHRECTEVRNLLQPTR
jgi:hypothetical protein